MDLLFIAILVVHIAAAAAWVGGAIMLELAFNPKILSITRIQGGLVSKRVEDLFTITAWTSLATMSITGLLLSAMRGLLSLDFLFGRTGIFLLAGMVLTVVAISDGLIISLYIAPKLKLIKNQDSRLRDLVRILIRGNSLIGLTVVVLMVVFAQLAISIIV